MVCTRRGIAVPGEKAKQATLMRFADTWQNRDDDRET
jgi:hypothetical protein